MKDYVDLMLLVSTNMCIYVKCFYGYDGKKDAELRQEIIERHRK
jgi:hypothetical protein